MRKLGHRSPLCQWFLDNSEALYLCEDGGTGSDIHGRDATSKIAMTIGFLFAQATGELLLVIT